MKAVILAGGLGTRLSEETLLRPKPMVEIGGMPILWHIMKIYSHYGVNDFIICCGYRGYLIKEYFSNYFLHQSDVTVDLVNNKVIFDRGRAEPWVITLVDTGEFTMTGGRLLRISHLLSDSDNFCLTYGDGLGNINVASLIEFHLSHGKLATLTAAIPPARFGRLELNGSRVERFLEKPAGDGNRINGGFFVLRKNVLELLGGDDCVWEDGPLTHLAEMGELMAYIHEGFWQPMDTLRDKTLLEDLWRRGVAPWGVWGNRGG